MTQELTQQYLKECLDYNPDTGIFVWKKRPLHHFKDSRSANSANSRMNSKKITNMDSCGYIQVKINSIIFQCHRLSWLYVYGYMPENQIDHINGVRNDNRIVNLREATRSENQQNQSNPHGETSCKKLGVYYHKKNEKFYSMIGINGSKKYLGCFNTAIEAHNAYLQAKRQLHPFGEI